MQFSRSADATQLHSYVCYRQQQITVISDKLRQRQVITFFNSVKSWYYMYILVGYRNGRNLMNIQESVGDVTTDKVCTYYETYRGRFFSNKSKIVRLLHK